MFRFVSLLLFTFASLAPAMMCEEAIIQLTDGARERFGKYNANKKYSIYLTFNNKEQALAVALLFEKDAWVSNADPKTIALKTQIPKLQQVLEANKIELEKLGFLQDELGKMPELTSPAGIKGHHGEVIIDSLRIMKANIDHMRKGGLPMGFSDMKQVYLEKTHEKLIAFVEANPQYKGKIDFGPKRDHLTCSIDFIADKSVNKAQFKKDLQALLGEDFKDTGWEK